MTREYIARLNAAQVERLHGAYSVIAATYEDIMGGPMNCRGIKEYHAVMDSREALRQRFMQLTAGGYGQ